MFFTTLNYKKCRVYSTMLSIILMKIPRTWLHNRWHFQGKLLCISLCSGVILLEGRLEGGLHNFLPPVFLYSYFIYSVPSHQAEQCNSAPEQPCFTVEHIATKALLLPRNTLAHKTGKLELILKSIFIPINILYYICHVLQVGKG